VDIHDYIAACRTHLRAVLLVVVTSILAAGAVWWTRPTVYQARVDFFVSAEGGSIDASQAYQGGLFVQQRVLTYAHLVSSSVVAHSVIGSVRPPMTAERFSREVSASVPTNTAILDVRVTDPAATRAQAVASALAKTFPRLVGLLEQPSSHAAQPVKISVISPPERPTAPVSRHPVLFVAIGLVLGVVVAVAVALALDVENRRVRHASEATALVQHNGRAPLREHTVTKA